MWKPGTAAPPRSRSPSRSPPPGPGAANNTSKNGGGTTPSKSKAPKKRLSSGTMGMRFMKRKAEAAEAAKKSAAEKEQAQAEREAMEWSAAGTGGGGGDGDDGEAMSEDDTVIVPLSATAADVYGIDAEIVGRRSFGDFNKAVQETYSEAIESKARDRSGARAEKQQITDEELLRRYEKYIKGKGDMGDRKASPIGNLQKKRNKKKGKDQGEKRKR